MKRGLVNKKDTQKLWELFLSVREITTKTGVRWSIHFQFSNEWAKLRKILTWKSTLMLTSDQILSGNKYLRKGPLWPLTYCFQKQSCSRIIFLCKWPLLPWPTELKIKRDHVFTETNHHVKYEGSNMNGSQEIERKPSVTAD